MQLYKKCLLFISVVSEVFKPKNSIIMKHVKVIFLLAMTFCISHIALANTPMIPYENNVTISEQVKNLLIDSEVVRVLPMELNLM